MATIKVLIFLILIINSIPFPSFSCPLYQKQALLHFKSALLHIDPSSYYYDEYESWSSNSDCCSWNQVTCSKAKTRTVIELDLSEIIPSFGFDILTPLFHIRSLKLLDISSNGLVGPIPRDGFENLTELVYLDMRENKFNGSIPDQIFGLTKLRYLYMGDNSFEGNIGPEEGYFWNLTSSLQDLDLNHNKLNGVLSPGVGKLQYLEWLDLSVNSLTGNIPKEIGNLTRLRELHLAYNQFSGGIPCSIANMKNLEQVDLSYNSFSMQIPSGIGTIPNMTRLVLNCCLNVVELEASKPSIGGRFPIVRIRL